MDRTSLKQIKNAYKDTLFQDQQKPPPSVGIYDLFWMYLMKFITGSFNGNILDAGCGDGRYSFSLIKKGVKEIYAVDLFEELPFKEEHLVYQQASIDHLPYENMFFDVLFSQSVIYYLRDCEKGIKEFQRVLKPGGVLIFSAHTKYSLYTIVRKIKLLFHCKSVEHLRYASFHSSRYYAHLLKTNGFELVKIDGWGMPLFDAFSSLLSAANKVFHCHIPDSRKRISANTFWCHVKAIFGYHMIIVAIKRE